MARPVDILIIFRPVVSKHLSLFIFGILSIILIISTFYRPVQPISETLDLQEHIGHLTTISRTSTENFGADVHTVFHGPEFIFPNGDPKFQLENTETAEKSTKTILLWLEQMEKYQSTGSSIFSRCPEKRCTLTTNRDNLNHSAAVLFLAYQYSPACKVSEPKRTSPNQIFTYVMGESPLNGLGCGFLLKDHFFNWTMTYRLDSDVRAHYTYYTKVLSKPRNFAKEKTKMVAWIVSHCNTSAGSYRERYVAELKKYVFVDVYGRCGNLTCGTNCKEVMKDYKFYMAFENSLCKDYITEKTVMALESGLVPIVYGDGNYHIFPPNSYIHIYNFSSPASLADYLIYLDQNDTAYNDLMKWRYDPKLAQSHGSFSAKANGFCRLCEKLHLPHLKRTSKSYYSILKWWYFGVDTKVPVRQISTRMCRGPEELFKKWQISNSSGAF